LVIQYNGEIVFSFTRIQGIILGADEVIDEIAEGVSGMDLDRIDEVGDS
jgi:hypothetical protein